MLEDRSLGNSQRGSDVSHSSGMVTLLGEMLHGGVDDARCACLRSAGAAEHVAVQRRRNPLLAIPDIISDLKSQKHT